MEKIKYIDLDLASKKIVYDNCFETQATIKNLLRPKKGFSFRDSDIKNLSVEYGKQILDKFDMPEYDPCVMICLKCKCDFKAWDRVLNRICTKCINTNKGISRRSEYTLEA